MGVDYSLPKIHIRMKKSICLSAVTIIKILLPLLCLAQSKNPALDSMGANMGRQNWERAIHWALKAAEADPSEKYWRYLNAAIFASRDHNADLAIKYAALVVDSEIATNAGFGSSFDWLRKDSRWIQLMDRVAQLKEKERQKRIQESLPFRDYQRELLGQTEDHLGSLVNIPSVEELYKAIQITSPVHSYSHSGRFGYYWLTLSDSLEFPYLVQLPINFDARRRYPMVVVLHGAVSRQTTLPDVADSTRHIAFFGRPFFDRAYQSGMIAVFPYSTNRYNWMMPDDGFDLVPDLVRQVKKMYSIDDQRVYLAGHSNGATGAFSYLLKQPGLFAGFAGLNNRPQVRTGGTFLLNGTNRSFYNVSTDNDYYFPIEGHRTLTNLTKQLNIDWVNQEVVGHRSHSFLVNSQDSTVVKVYEALFNNLLAKKRNPFQPRLYWECDNVRHGRVDWLAINELDTLIKTASWHTHQNFAVTGWREVMNPEIILDSTSQAFVFPRRSGAVKAYYSNNRFDLKTSRVKSVSIYLSPEMIDFKKPLAVVINGISVFNGNVSADREFVIDAYRQETDHQAIWIKRLQFTVPKK
ncbi:hypothetical protein DYBT9275_05460 [Dyadobacter sp. CECT 9275]|uniref:Poly(3-hydroxybutyrate) depolymerase n=2 Tax=Dyadobacter helix TaxID=2822344 RepID=A0A916JHH4_9BACT|nr:hypothetical protein DYBT9275_05460 [Dyadobacter sp. CECT 9275]